MVLRFRRHGRILVAAVAVATAGAALIVACVPSRDFRDTPDAANDAPTVQPDAPGDTSSSEDARPDTAEDATVDALADAGLDAQDLDASGMVAIQADGAPFFVRVNPNDPSVNQRVHMTHAFLLDRYEVTVDRFLGWVQAGQPVPDCDGGDCSLDPGGPYAKTMLWRSSFWNQSNGLQRQGFRSGSVCAFWNDAGAITPIDDGGYAGYLTYNRSDAGAQPVTCVTWYQAVAFCWWEGQKRLPTEMEWQFAAQAGTENRTYPWGSRDAGCSLALFDDGTGTRCGFPKPVGSAPSGASREGVLDLAGGVAEYAWDMQESQFPTTNDASDVVDYTGRPFPDGGEPYPQNAARGGSYWQDGVELDNRRRNSAQGDIPYLQMGFRCAATIR